MASMVDLALHMEDSSFAYGRSKFQIDIFRRAPSWSPKEPLLVSVDNTELDRPVFYLKYKAASNDHNICYISTLLKAIISQSPCL